jgi:hypothetical protein
MDAGNDVELSRPGGRPKLLPCLVIGCGERRRNVDHPNLPVIVERWIATA